MNDIASGASSTSLLISLIVIVCLFLTLVAFPVHAFASTDRVISKLESTAQVQTNGSMHVVEQKTIQFRDAYSAIAWRFGSLPSEAEVSVNSVRVIENGNDDISISNLPEISFRKSWSPLFEDGDGLRSEALTHFMEGSEHSKDEGSLDYPAIDAWSFDERSEVLYIFCPLQGEVLIECDYIIENEVLIYDDVAELYWDYVTQNDEALIENVAVNIQLPVPEGLSVAPGENVDAWGHGPEGNLDITPDGVIIYQVPKVSIGQYAQAHIIFPASWVVNASDELKSLYSGTRKDSAIAEELNWADVWSNSLINLDLMQLALIVLCMISLIVSATIYVVFGSVKFSDQHMVEDEKDPNSAGKAFPNNDDDLGNYSASVVGRVMRWNNRSTKDLVASIIQLCDEGVLQAFGGVRGHLDIELKIAPAKDRKRVFDQEQETLRILFDVFADDYQRISFTQIGKFARRFPDRFLEAISDWQERLSSNTQKGGFFDDSSYRARKVLIVLAIAIFVIGLINIPIVGWPWMIAPTLCAFVIVLLANYCQRYSKTGSSLAASVERELRSSIAYNGAEQAASLPSVNEASIDDGASVTNEDAALPYFFASLKKDEMASVLKDWRFGDDTTSLWFMQRKDRYGRLEPMNADAATEYLDRLILESQD